MTTSTQATGPLGDFSSEALLAALREGGPGMLAAGLGDLAHLLRALAQDPGRAFDADSANRAEAADLLTNIHACRGVLDAMEAHAVVALQEITRRERLANARDKAAREEAAVPSEGVVHEEADGVTAHDLTLITHRSPHAAGRTLASARRLVEGLPRMMGALVNGTLGTDAAYAIADAAAGVEPELMREVDIHLDRRLPECDGLGVRRWKDAVATVVGELDPEGEALRHQRARKERHVTLTPRKHGMAQLSALIPAVDARIIHKRLSLEAERRRAAGNREGHGAVMADAFVELLQGAGEGEAPRLSIEIGVIITDRALFRPESGDVAQLEGYGPVPAEAVRAQLRAALAEPEEAEEDPLGPDGPEIRLMIRRLYTHPTADELVGMDAVSRAFPTAMKRFLTWRDTRCRGPFCNAVIRQADHITPVSRGGSTSLDDGQQLCGHCNQKERFARAVERIEGKDGGHRVRWTGASGAQRTTAPTPLLGPESSARGQAVREQAAGEQEVQDADGAGPDPGGGAADSEDGAAAPGDDAPVASDGATGPYSGDTEPDDPPAATDPRQQ